MFIIAKRLAGALRNSDIRCQGANFFLADGAMAGQEIFHVHLHVLPRYAGDGFGFRFGPHHGQKPARASLDRMAAQIQAALASSGETECT